MYRDGYADSNNTSSPDPGRATGGFCAVGGAPAGAASAAGAAVALVAARGRLWRSRVGAAGRDGDDDPTVRGAGRLLAGAAVRGAGARVPRAPRSSRPRQQLVEGDRATASGRPSASRSSSRFGPYRPDVDCEFNGRREPVQRLLRRRRHLLTPVELDYQFFHRFGSLAVGVGAGYFSRHRPAPVGERHRASSSGDQSTLKVVPITLSRGLPLRLLPRTRQVPAGAVRQAGAGLGVLADHRRQRRDRARSQRRTGRGGTLGWHAPSGWRWCWTSSIPDAAREFDVGPGRQPHRDACSSSATTTSRAWASRTACTSATPTGRWACCSSFEPSRACARWRAGRRVRRHRLSRLAAPGRAAHRPGRRWKKPSAR